MSYADDFLTAHADVLYKPERQRKTRVPLVKIHIFAKSQFWTAAEQYARGLGAGTDWTEEAGMYILAVSGTLTQLACVQAYVDGIFLS